MVIRKMEPKDRDAWFDFFDSRAFADHKDWKGCYCTGFYMPRIEQYQKTSRSRKDYAEWLLETGLMKGYLAIDKGIVVGWCNVNEKSVYPRLKNLIDNDEEVISIACFLVQKDFRGKGIAQKILEKIIVDAKASTKKIVEAYPRKLSRTDYGKWHGSCSMYLKNGFRIENIGRVEVARLYL
jgi:GNAT superfamily N-acetyltransferase